MNQKISLATLVGLLLCLFSFGQSKINGRVLSSNGAPLSAATIILHPLNKQINSAQDGTFQFVDIPKGDYSLQVQLIGYQSKIQKLSLKEDRQGIRFVLEPSEEMLQTVEVTGRTEQQYKNALSYGGTKVAANIKEVPQSIQYVTKELMRDQGAVRMGDIVKNISGVNQYTFYDDVSIRGFRNQGGVGTSSSNQLFNGLRTFNGFWRQNLVNYLERVEIIKGPAAALFGNVNPGGTINKVTKKPLDTARRTINFQLGNFNTLRTNVDFTGPMNESKTVLYRLNLGYENAGSFRDLMFDKNIVIAPSISYIPSERTRVNVDAVYNKSNSRLDRGQSIFGSNDLYSTPISLNVADINDYLNEETYLLTASLSHQLSNWLTFNTSFLRTGYKQDLFEHRSTAFAVDKEGNTIESLAFRRASQRHNEQYSNSFTAYLTGEVQTGKVQQKLVLGYDFANSVIPVGSSQMDATGYRLKDGSIATKYVVKDSAKYQFYDYKGQMIPLPNVPSYDLTDNQHSLLSVDGYVYAANNTDVVVPFHSSQHSVYVQDFISYQRLKILLGLRWDSYLNLLNYTRADEKESRQNAFLPRIGATFEVNRNINVYATYAMGYNPQDARSQNKNAGGPFDPMTSNLLEAGLKTEWFNGRLSATLSAYAIQQRNVLYNALDPDNPDLLIQIGKDRSRGVELDVVGNILPNLSVITTYAYNHARLDGATAGADQAYADMQKPNSPANQGSVWAKYQFDRGLVKGLGIGAGGNYVGPRTFGFQGQQNILPSDGPSYTLFSGALYYKFNKMLLQLNINNLTNKTHWVGGYDSSRLYPGAPRTWLASITYDI